MAGTPPISLPQPTDLPTAHRVIDQLTEQLHKKDRLIQSLQHKLDELCHKLWGRSSEQVSEAQLKLAFEQLGQEPPAPVPATEPEQTEMESGEPVHPGRPRRRPKGRQVLPKNLPRRREVVDLTDAEKVCGCGAAKEKIGEAVAEKLDFVPASLCVVETVTPKYACPRCHEGVSTAVAPPQAV